MIRTVMTPISPIGHPEKQAMKPLWGPLTEVMAASVGLTLEQLQAAARGNLVLPGWAFDALASREYLWRAP
jgi:hypothetical protein